MITFDEQAGFVSENLGQRNVEAELRFQIEQLQESWDEAAGAMLRLQSEDEGWRIMGAASEKDGFSMKVLKQIAKKAEIQSVGNPLLKAAFDLRFNPIFSRGFEIEGKMKPRYERKLENETVKETLFTEAGYEMLEKTCFNVGNLFVLYNKVTGDIQRIPFEQIRGRAVDPDMETRTAYYKWTRTRTDFNGKSKSVTEWIPVVEWAVSGKDDQDKIGQDPVNHDYIFIDMRVNVPSTGHWGIPDAFPALPYAWAYAEYIRDATSLLKAHNLIAWRVVGKSKPQAQAAGVALAGQRRAAGVAAMTAGTTVDALPKSGLVDMADGRAIAALVASAVGVSTSALLSTADSGSGASIQSLDGPTVAMARSRQKRWVDFYERIFKAMGIDELTINFPKITEDPIHRQVSSLATGRATGAIWADEYRDAFLEAMSIKPTHAAAPDVEEYARAANALGFMNLMEQEVARQEAGDPIARQGNSGVAGRLGEIDNTNRNQDAKAGSGTQTDLVG